IAFTEDVAKRFEAYHWQVIVLDGDGNNLDAIQKALAEGRRDITRPTLIKLRTHIAFGSPNKQDTAGAHGAPLGVEEVCLTKECLGCPPDVSFCVSEAVRKQFGKIKTKGAAAQAEWQARFDAYKAAHPDLADQLVDALSGFLPAGWDDEIPCFQESDGPVATRAASGQVLNAIAARLPTLMGGSADLAPSNKTYLNGVAEFQKGSYEGRNIRFGVREHAMGSVMSGIFLHNGVRPYGGTFLVFSDYMRPAIRVASLMKLPVIYVFTHDSVAVGEDGPTHQPVEQLLALRAIPGLTVIRPADANETAEAWRMAVQTTNRPVALILSRQKLPILAADKVKGGVERGGYVLSDCEGAPRVILIGTGAEVHLALAAQAELAQKGIPARVVNLPCWEIFQERSESYRRSVLPPEVKARLAIEAGTTLGWERYVGDGGAVIGIDRFGASAPGGTVLEKYGFTVANVVAKAEALLK
ncbi:MAG: transketolase, partial [Desulfosarcinaceae bacterium]